MLQLTLIMTGFSHIIRLFDAYIYYVYINRLEGVNICMCFICLKNIQSKSAFASLTVLQPHLLSNLAQRKPCVVILLYTDTKIAQYQIPI